VQTHIYRIGIAIGLLSVSAFFIALIIAYSFRIEDQHTWERFAVPNALWLSTILLAVSSWTFEAARHVLRRGLVQLYRARVVAAEAFAILFLAAQFASARNMFLQGVAASGNPHGSAFYVFMGLHGLHLTGGILWLAVLYFTSSHLVHGSESDMRAHRRLAGAAAMYWHFMAVLWVVLFYFLLRWTEQ
jgi:cytochrome c oxidase subunit 3